VKRTITTLAALVLPAPSAAARPSAWVPCTRNAETGRRSHARGASVIDLGTNVPFIVNAASPHPKYQIESGHDVGLYLIDAELHEAFQEVQW
jgi:hypothetical protein